MAGNSPWKHIHSRSLESDVSQAASLGDSVLTADNASDYFAIMSAAFQEDVNDVLNEVIDKINRITDHVREKGESEAANRFTHDMTTTLQNLYHIIAPWDIDKCLMKCDMRTQTRNAAQRSDQRSTNRLKCMPTPSPGTTWAAIAATEPLADRNGIIKFGPSDGIQIKVSERSAEHETISQNPDDLRVVWVGPWSADRPLSEISKKMQNLGALYSFAFDPQSAAVCMIFQQAACATDFIRRCAQHVDYHGIPPFGADIQVTLGLPYPATRELSRMDLPYMERRRLTFARAGLFNKDGVTQEQFRQDIECLVGGPSHIHLLWFFNSGNATVVLSAVSLSKSVRDTFIQYGCAINSPYHGIMVTYSHDPCERDMHLVSQIPGHPGYIGGGSLPAPGPRARGSTLSSSVSGAVYGNTNGHYTPAHKRRITGSNGPKPNIDKDGWETVKKRR